MHKPRDLLILSLPRLDGQALVIHLMHITRRLHVAQDVVLQLRHGLERIRHVLVLLDVTDHLSRLGALGEVDKVRLLDDGRDTVFDEGQVGQIDAYTLVRSEVTSGSIESPYRRKGCMGGWRSEASPDTRQSSSYCP